MTTPDAYRNIAARLSRLAESFGDGSRRCRDTLLQIESLTRTLEKLWIEDLERRERPPVESQGVGLSDRCVTTEPAP